MFDWTYLVYMFCPRIYPLLCGFTTLCWWCRVILLGGGPPQGCDLVTCIPFRVGSPDSHKPLFNAMNVNRAWTEHGGQWTGSCSHNDTKLSEIFNDLMHVANNYSVNTSNIPSISYLGLF